MKTKYFLIFLVLLLSQVFGNMAAAQHCLVFSYDANGNRVQRIMTDNCNSIRDYDEVQETNGIDEMTVYPNPTEGNLRICFPTEMRKTYANYKIYDLNGVMLCESTINSDEMDVDLGAFPSGIYLLRIISGEDMYSRIIVKH